MEGMLALLKWLIDGPGCGVLGWWLVNHLKWPQDYPMENKRNWSFVFAGALGIASQCLLTWLLSNPWPTTPQGWAIALADAALRAFGTATLVHGATNLRAQDKEAKIERETAFTIDDCDVPEM